MKPSVISSGSLAALLALGAACGSPPAGTPPAPASQPAPQPATAPQAPATLDELRNATYQGIDIWKHPVTLAQGKWEGMALGEGGASRPEVRLVRDFRVAGDLDGDGDEETAVLLSATAGGSGFFTYLAVVDRRSGRLENVGTAMIGDRVQIRSLKILDGNVFVEVVQGGPDDAACCPGDLATRGWTLGPGGLTEFVTSKKTGRLSLAALGGTRWVLRSWDLDKPAPEKPEVTLQLTQGRFAGRSGCNQYFATVTQGQSPGDLTLGPAGATRMACAEPIMAVEGRYLGLLTGVRKFGFMAGQMALSYEKDGVRGVLLFDAIPGSAP